MRSVKLLLEKGFVITLTLLLNVINTLNIDRQCTKQPITLVDIQAALLATEAVQRDDVIEGSMIGKTGYKVAKVVTKYLNEPHGATLRALIAKHDTIEGKTSIVAYRGNDETKVLDKFKSDLEDYGETEVFFSGKKTNVNKYIWLSFSKLYYQLEKYLYHPERRYIITGHSLGGAMASLLAIMTKSRNKGIPWNHPGTCLITFGQPRVGDKSFANRHDELISPTRKLRFVNRYDIVPHIPTSSAYQHHSREVWINRENAPLTWKIISLMKNQSKHFMYWKLCGEGEPSYCSNRESLLRLNPRDHSLLKYRRQIMNPPNRYYSASDIDKVNNWLAALDYSCPSQESEIPFTLPRGHSKPFMHNFIYEPPLEMQASPRSTPRSIPRSTLPPSAHRSHRRSGTGGSRNDLLIDNNNPLIDNDAKYFEHPQAFAHAQNNAIIDNAVTRVLNSAPWEDEAPPKPYTATISVTEKNTPKPRAMRVGVPNMKISMMKNIPRSRAIGVGVGNTNEVAKQLYSDDLKVSAFAHEVMHARPHQSNYVEHVRPYQSNYAKHAMPLPPHNSHNYVEHLSTFNPSHDYDSKSNSDMTNKYSNEPYNNDFSLSTFTAEEATRLQPHADNNVGHLTTSLSPSHTNTNGEFKEMINNDIQERYGNGLKVYSYSSEEIPGNQEKGSRPLSHHSNFGGHARKTFKPSHTLFKQHTTMRNSYVKGRRNNAVQERLFAPTASFLENHPMVKTFLQHIDVRHHPAVQKFIQHIVDTQTDGGVSNINNNLNRMPDNINNNLNRMPNNIKNNLNRMPDNINNNWNRMPDNINNNLNRMPDNINNNLNRIPDNINNNLNRMPDNIKNNLKRMPDNINNNLNRMADNINNNVDRMPDNIDNNLNANAYSTQDSQMSTWSHQPQNKFINPDNDDANYDLDDADILSRRIPTLTTGVVRITTSPRAEVKTTSPDTESAKSTSHPEKTSEGDGSVKRDNNVLVEHELRKTFGSRRWKQFREPTHIHTIKKHGEKRRKDHNVAPTKKDGSTTLQELFESTAVPWKPSHTRLSTYSRPVKEPSGTPHEKSNTHGRNSDTIKEHEEKADDSIDSHDSNVHKAKNTPPPPIKKPGKVSDCFGPGTGTGATLDTFVTSKQCNEKETFENIVKLIGPSEQDFQIANDQYADKRLLNRGIFNDVSGFVKRGNTPHRTKQSNKNLQVGS